MAGFCCLDVSVQRCVVRFLHFSMIFSAWWTTSPLESAQMEVTHWKGKCDLLLPWCQRALECECLSCPWPQIADVSVEVATVDHTLQKIYRKYRKTRRKPKGLEKLWTRLLNIPHLAVITTAVVFMVMVIMWSLLWVFICKWDFSTSNFRCMLVLILTIIWCIDVNRSFH